MVQPQHGFSRGVSFYFRQCVTYTAILSLLGLCTACGGTIQAQDNTSETPSVTNISSTTRVVALGKLVPEGDVIKISVANAQDSRVNQILVKEGDFVKANQIIAILQGKDRAEQQLRDARANVAIKRAQLLKIQQGDVKEGELTAQRAAIAELEARIRSETKQREAAIAEVYETDIVKVRPGLQAIVTSEYGGFGGEIRGKVDQIGLQIGKTRLNQDQSNPTNDVNARVVEVKIRLNPQDSPKVAALTGMQVRVKINTGSN